MEPSQKDERYEEFVRTYTQHERDLRRFIRSLLPSWSDADDVLQLSAIVIWNKFDQFDPETNFMNWACVIARFEALSYRRKFAKDRLVFREEVIEIMADEGVEEMQIRRDEFEALESCLKELPEKQQRFIKLAYTPGIKVKDMAEEAGASADSFYMRLKRLRRKLMICVELKTQHQTPNS